MMKKQPPFESEFVIRWLLEGPAVYRQIPRDALTQTEIARLGKFESNVAAIWREHESWLREQAARLSIEPSWPAKRFYCEALAASNGRW